MYIDMFGKTRQKINLHMHTTLSDGALTPEEAAKRYREAGYDAVFITDHWVVGENRVIDGLPVLSGCEYDIGDETLGGVYHILALGMEGDPKLTRRADLTPTEIVSEIHRMNGFAVLAHPAWSLETVDQIRQVKGADATEIYNTVSDFGESYRADSSLIVDQLATRGIYYGLIADDDAHYYMGDECRSYLMLEAENVGRDAVLEALRAQKYYATQGPELHARIEDGKIIVDCSPVKRINICTNRVWRDGSVFRGYNLTHAESPLDGITFARVECEDEMGRKAWTNVIYSQKH